MQHNATLPSVDIRQRIPARDPNPALTPGVLQGTYGNPGLYDEMIYTHPVIASGVEAARDGIAEAQLEWSAPEEPSFAEVYFTAKVDELFHTMTTDRLTQAPHTDVLRAVLDVLFKGVALFEVSWYRYHGDLRLELAPIHPSTVWSVNYDSDSRTIASYTLRTNEGHSTLPAHKVLRVDNQSGTEGPFGVSILRPLVAGFDIWKTQRTGAARSMTVEASGLQIIETQPAADQAQADTAMSSAVAFSRGEADVVYTPFGYDIKPLDRDGSMWATLMEQLRYYDDQVNKAMLSALMSLGFSTYGSLALGTAVAADDSIRGSARLNSVLAVFGRAFSIHIARALNYQERVPTLSAVREQFLDPEQELDVVERVHEVAQVTGEDPETLAEEVL